MSPPTPFPPLHIIAPSTAPHTHTLLALHGRGSQGPEFATDLFENTTSSGFTLQQQFPNYKWVFPPSQERYSTVFQEEMDEWFDIYSLTDPAKREELQVEGLRESVRYLHRLIAEEIEYVKDSSRIILLGLSQGCATGLLTLLAGNMRLGALTGLNGWIPFRAQIEEIVKNGPQPEISLRLGGFFWTMLGLEEQGTRSEILSTVVFLGHTKDDEIIDVKLGQDMRLVLEAMGMRVTWNERNEGGHLGFLETAGLDDVAAFLAKEVGGRRC